MDRKLTIQIVNKAALKRLAILLAVCMVLAIGSWFTMIRMPGKTSDRWSDELTDHELALSDMLRKDIETLAGEIGTRWVGKYDKLREAADFIEVSLREAGYTVSRQEYEVEGKTCSNLEVEISGSDSPEEIVIIGAHYDTIPGCPGANDNGSGVAALLALARASADMNTAKTLRFVAFVNEEPPYFQTNSMGSLVYARRCREKGEKIVAMMSLETVGYYTDEPNTQQYPFPLSLFYPSTGNFVGFVGNFRSRDLVRKTVGSFRKHSDFPSQGGAILSVIPGVGWSDHWAFWHEGYPAVMVTDTAMFRYPYYHHPGDTPDKIRFTIDRMAQVVAGLEKVVSELVE